MSSQNINHLIKQHLHLNTTGLDKQPSNVGHTTMTEGAAQLLKQMQAGQVFSGEITDIRGSYLQINLNGGQTVMAQLSDQFEFFIGQKAIFQVKENNGTQLLIKPVMDMQQENPQDMVAGRALEAAGLAVTKSTLELVKNLMALKQPIDRQTLSGYMKQMLNFPDVDLKTLITLTRNHIPVTQENINQLNNYSNTEHQLMRDINHITEELPFLLSETVQEEGSGKALNLLENLLNVWEQEPMGQPAAETGEAAAKAAALLQGEQPAALSGGEKEVKNNLTEVQQDEIKALVKDLGGSERLLTLLKDPAASPKEILDELKQVLKQDAALEKPVFSDGHDFQKLFQSEGVRFLLKENMTGHLLLSPEEVMEEGRVVNYYKKLTSQTERLKTILSEFGKTDTPLGKAASNMGDNLKFMQNLNEVLTYIQLPVKLTGQDAHGELYVYTKKKNMGKPGEELTAALHLDMENLGAVDVFIRLKGKNVSTNFTLESEEMLDFIEQHMDMLEKRLHDKGYHCTSTVTQRKEEGKTDLLSQLVNTTEVQPLDMKRYSFDVRA